MKKRLDHASGFATVGLGAGRNKAAGKFSKLTAWVPFTAARMHAKMR
jgi:hypothetical protein